MPKFTMTRQFLVPHYQHVIIEAASVEEACLVALGLHPTVEEPAWEYDRSGAADMVREDFDNARPTEIERIVAGEWRQRGEGGPELGDPNPYAPRPDEPQPTEVEIPTDQQIVRLQHQLERAAKAVDAT
jgi:hypothetical protein